MDKTEKQIEDALVQATRQTFSEMAFLDVMRTRETPPEKNANAFKIRFYSSHKGELVLFMSLECKKKVAENIHGKNWGKLSSNSKDDCFLEMDNVLAGSFLNFLKEKEPKVGFPQALFSLSEIQELDSYFAFGFDAEGAPFTIFVKIS